MIRRLRGDRRGAAMLEFALVAPLLMAFIFLIIEGGRMIWTHQVLQEVAFASARCMALGNTGCTSTATVKTWAAARASGSGVTVAEAAITPTAAATCEAQANMVKVVILMPYGKAVGSLLPVPPASLAASACFPVLT